MLGPKGEEKIMENATKIEKKESLKEEFDRLNVEFKEFLRNLTSSGDIQDSHLSTYSPLDIVSEFEPRGLQTVREVSADEMLANESGLKKLLANMLSHCKPEALSKEDVEMLSGINGREMETEL